MTGGSGWRRWGAPAIGAAGALALVGPGYLRLVPFVAVVGLLASVMPAATRLRRAAYAVLAFVGALAAVLTALAIARVQVDWRLLILGHLVGATALAARWPTRATRRIASAEDVWASGVAAVTFAMLIRPFVGVSPGRAMALLSHSTDPANHLQLVGAVLRHGGYVTFASGLGPHLQDGMTQYPPGLAGAVATVLGVTYGPHATPAEILHVAAPVFMSLYALLTWFAVAVTLAVVRRCTGSNALHANAVALVLLALVLLVGFNVFLVQDGFYTQIVATTVVLALVLVAIDGTSPSTRSSVTVAALIVAGCQTWYLMAPLCLVPAVAHLWSVRHDLKRLAAIAIPTAVFCAFPVVTGPSPGGQLNMPGPAPLPTIAGILGLLLMMLAALSVLGLGVQRGHHSRTVLVATVVAAMFLALIIIGFELRSGHSLNYYGAKLLYTLFLLGSVAGAAALAITIVRIGNRATRRSVAAVVSAAIAAGPAAAAATTATLVVPYIAGHPPAHLDGAVLDAVFRDHPRGVGPAGDDVWVFGGCNRSLDEISTKWAYDLGGGRTEGREQALDHYIVSAGRGVPALVARAASVAPRRVEIYTHDPCSEGALSRFATTPNVRVVRVP